MPYISVDKRVKLDPAIRELQICLVQYSKPENVAGNLNYVMTRLLDVVPVVHKSKWRYHLCNLVVGVLECCKQEFYRRLVGSLEDLAIEKNGDVETYEE